MPPAGRSVLFNYIDDEVIEPGTEGFEDGEVAPTFHPDWVPGEKYFFREQPTLIKYVGTGG